MHTPQTYLALALIYLPVTAALAVLVTELHRRWSRGTRRRRDKRRRYRLPLP